MLGGPKRTSVNWRAPTAKAANTGKRGRKTQIDRTPEARGNPPTASQCTTSLASTISVKARFSAYVRKERRSAIDVRLHVATLPRPFLYQRFGGAFYYSANGEGRREEAVNEWIRSSGPFDGVLHFDKATPAPTT